MILSVPFLKIIVTDGMKRKPSQQLSAQISSSKETIKRLKSPQTKKIQHKKPQEIPSVILPKHKIPRSREEIKGDSNNTTTSTRPKQSKLGKRAREKSFEGLGQRQVMSIINGFATKIQRQWRAYYFRKSFCKFLTILKEQREKSAQNEFFELKFNNEKIKRLVQFEEEEISSGTTLYDKQKYQNLSSNRESNYGEKQVCESSVKSTKAKGNKVVSKSSNTTPRDKLQKSSSQAKTPRETSQLNEQLSRSLERPLSYSEIRQTGKDKEARRASFNILEEKKFLQSRRHSTGQLPSKKPLSEKQLQIGKAYDIHIELSQKKMQVSEESPCKAKRFQSQGRLAFKKGSSIQKMMRKCKKQIQIAKLRQLLSVQNRYNKNQVTYRSYLEIVGKINEEHCSKMEEIKAKEGRFKNALGDLLDAYKARQMEGRFLEDEPHSSSHLDVSLSFDKWDFNSSAKKSIDHFDFPEGNGSKGLSIESVLRELDEEESGAVSDQKRFKKNKSLQIIEAIAERSKQISEKDICSFEGTPPHTTQAIAIKEIEEFKNQDKDVLEQQKQEHKIEKKIQEDKQLISQGSIECSKQIIPDLNLHSSSKISKKGENDQQFPSSPSLLITPQGVTPLVHSQSSIEPHQQQVDVINELIYKEVKTVSINYEEPLISKFRQLVIEKILMTNIKLINSIKFAFAKAAEESKKLKSPPIPSIPHIDSDINAINTWLLQISHFVLDNYKQIIRDNLLLVRQPPIGEVLAMARKGLYDLPPYQTVPEYVFKDFQFYYIKTLQKNNGIPLQHYDKFSSLLYIFHRVLIDSLNSALMEQLATGKDWVRTPWKMPQKFKAIIEIQDYVKICLERSINVVSNWGQYGLGRLVLDDDFSQTQYRQFQEEKIKLVCKEEVLQSKLNPTFCVGNIMLLLAEWQYEKEIELLVEELMALQHLQH